MGNSVALRVVASTISMEEATKDQLLKAAKYAGIDELTNEAGRAFWKGVDGETMLVRDVIAIHVQLRKYGYSKISITDPNWVKPC